MNRHVTKYDKALFKETKRGWGCGYFSFKEGEWGFGLSLDIFVELLNQMGYTGMVCLSVARINNIDGEKVWEVGFDTMTENLHHWTEEMVREETEKIYNLLPDTVTQEDLKGIYNRQNEIWDFLWAWGL